MKACDGLEDRLLDYDELSPDQRIDVDAHVLGCQACRDYLTLLRDIDAALSTGVQHVHLEPRRAAAIRLSARAATPIRRISMLPEWLDFVAAAAVLAFASGLAWQAGLFIVMLNALSVSR